MQVGDASRTQLARVARGGAHNLAGAGISSICGFALVVIVTNYFDADTAGTLFSSTSLFVVVTALAVFGSETGIAHFMLKFEEEGRGGDLPALLRTGRRTVLLLSIVLTIAGLAAADPIAGALGLHDSSSPTLIRVLAVAVPFAAVSQFLLGETRAMGRMRPTVAVDLLIRPLSQLSGAWMVGIAGGGLIALTISWSLPFVVLSFASAFLARQLVRNRRVRWSGAPTVEQPVIRREFWRYTVPRGIAMLCQVIIQRADIILIAAIVGVEEAAVYTAATRFVAVGQMGVRAIQVALLARFSQLIARRDMGTLADVFKISTAWSMGALWPIYTATASAAGLYLGIFGDGYRGSDGIWVVVTMAIGMMAATAAGPLDTLLLMSGRSVASLVNGVVAVIANVVLCLVLIPAWGILGAAVAWTVAVIIRNAMAFVQVVRDLGLTPFSRAGAVIAAAVALCYAAPLGTLSALDALSVPVFVAAFVAGSSLYGAIVWRARGALALTALRSATAEPNIPAVAG